MRAKKKYENVNSDYSSYASPKNPDRKDFNNNYMMTFKGSRESIDSVKPRHYYLTSKCSPSKIKELSIDSGCMNIKEEGQGWKPTNEEA
jgi:hypothetical protein